MITPFPPMQSVTTRSPNQWAGVIGTSRWADSEEDAALLFLDQYNPASIRANLEIYSFIVQREDGMYTVLPAQLGATGESRNMNTYLDNFKAAQISGVVVTAGVHAHAAHPGALFSTHSDGDVGFTNFRRMPLYLGTPGGRFKRLYPGLTPCDHPERRFCPVVGQDLGPLPPRPEYNW
jgi:hypothetical protein